MGSRFTIIGKTTTVREQIETYQQRIAWAEASHAETMQRLTSMLEAMKDRCEHEEGIHRVSEPDGVAHVCNVCGRQVGYFPRG